MKRAKSKEELELIRKANSKKELEVMEKVKKQELAEQKLQNKLASLELNMEWTIKTLRNAEAAGIFNSQAAVLQVFFEAEDKKDKNKAKMLPPPEVLEEQDVMEKVKKWEEQNMMEEKKPWLLTRNALT